ncbi:MAG TPA: hypothetical protein VHY82_12725, partial [Acetobacteraceae bacterium]|nr:hypothetical protein [Acetobacteraceae bacterium]
MRAPWKSTSAPPTSAVVIAPYHPDIEPRSRARLKRYVTIALVVFCFLYGLTFALLAPFLLVVFAVPIAVLGTLAVWALPDAR